jgi:acyl-CoA synthetase (AMP-forming)/AMP-acid ligase II/acetyltransferase-like isoleucine patch superfamily enzyme/acyl carrier protein
MMLQLTSERPSRHAAARSIYDLLKGAAERDASATAIAAPGRRPAPYHRLLGHVEKAARTLSSLGLNRNDRVALVLPNGPEMAVAFLATASAATCAPLNPAYREEEFDFYITDLGARALIVASGMDTPATTVARKHRMPIIELAPAVDAEAGLFTLDGGEVSERHCGDFSFAEASDIALVLHTSGTTSRPKIVPLTQANLCSSAANIADTLALTAKDRCLNVMPLFHIHGLIGALLSSLSMGGSVVCAPGFVPEEFFGWLDAFQPTWYTAAPTIHQAVLARADANREIIARRPLRLIRSSSAALPKQVIEDLEKTFQTRVIEAYSMTEASHQMTSNPLGPLPRKPGSVGLPAGPEVGIMDEAGRLLPPGEIGEVVVRGANVTEGYENNPKANDAAFTNGWFRTGDQGRFDPDGYLFLTGRLKEIIVQGGEKIAPSEVDEVLSRHSAVAQAVTFAVPHPTLGEDVAAAVVLKRGARVTEGELRDFVGSRLAAFKTPRQILFVDEIPKGPTGKLQRIGLADKLAHLLALKREENFVLARTSVEEEVAEIWREVLNADRVGVRDDFNALGGDSLSMATMILQVEERFKVEVPIDGFLKAPTVETLVRLIRPDEGGTQQVDANGARPARPIADSGLAGLKNRLLQWIALYIPGNKTSRVWLHRMRGVSIGRNVSIGLSALIETAYPRLVSIGDNVTIGVRAVIIAHFRDSTFRSRLLDRPTVRLEDNVYLGPGVIVLPNVTIGHGSVVSAGSVVTRSVPPRTFVQGNPAKPIAHCGVSLGGGVPYERFIRELTPIKDVEV